MTPQEQYADVRERMTAIARTLDEGALATDVPATPGWTVKDLLAHSSAVVTDAVQGNLDGAGSDEWTARQVAARRDLSIEQILDEWTASAAVAEPRLNDYPKGLSRTLIVDLVTHEHDLRGALGMPGGRDSEAYEVARKGYHVSLAKTLEQRGMPGLRLTAGDGWEFDAGEGPAVTVHAPDSFELFRALSGRRSRGQVLAYDWSGDPAPYLDVLNRFGPLPEQDVVEKS